LYYYRLYLFNDKDSISLGDQVFKTAGQSKIEWLDDNSKNLSSGHAYKSTNISGSKSLDEVDKQSQSSLSSDLFHVADLAFLLLCLSIFLLLLAILRHYRKQIKRS
jgi:hypothetical protein